MKLKVGDIILVRGSVPFDKLEQGARYRVNKIRGYLWYRVYTFTKPLGKRELASYRVSEIDYWINANIIKIIP